MEGGWSWVGVGKEKVLGNRGLRIRKILGCFFVGKAVEMGVVEGLNVG